MVYYKDDELIIRSMEETDDKEFYEALTAQGWHPQTGDWLKRIKDETEGKCITLTAVYQEQAAEKLAVVYADTVCLGVGVCDSYGSAQRMYVKRGYIPDGSGVWYQDKQCVQYETVCTVDDDLIMYLYKKLKDN